MTDRCDRFIDNYDDMNGGTYCTLPMGHHGRHEPAPILAQAEFDRITQRDRVGQSVCRNQLTKVRKP